jgi:transcriptional regulator with XRE-family HTH domain
MSEGKTLTLIQTESEGMISARKELRDSFRDKEYRRAFVAERVHSSTALQIRALREQRKMSQSALGAELNMAQTWISKLENPDYGKMTIATLLRLADAFDTDLEIKFRPFSETINDLPRQGRGYFHVPSFDDEFSISNVSDEQNERASKLQAPKDLPMPLASGAKDSWTGCRDEPKKLMNRARESAPRLGSVRKLLYASS